MKSTDSRRIRKTHPLGGVQNECFMVGRLVCMPYFELYYGHLMYRTSTFFDNGQHPTILIPMWN